MRKLASVRTVSEIRPIENADMIEVAVIDGWECVVKKNSVQLRDMIVYFEIDSFIPTHEAFEFLRKSSYKKMVDGSEGFRLKTIRLRGVYSQGLVMPLKDLVDAGLLENKSRFVDEDLTEELKVTLYEPAISVSLSGIAKGIFPSFIPKTDENRVQNLTNYQAISKDIFYVTEKLDGSSATFYFKDGEFGVCSRNLDLKETDDNTFWQIAKKLQIDEKLKSYGKNIALQGELIGEGVQGNKYKIKGHTVKFFNVFDIDTQKYLNFENFKNVINDFGYETVPIIDENMTLPENRKDLIEMADGMSKLNDKTKREGMVIRTKLDNRFSFKAISNRFLMDEKE